ncbi:hypothetical protein CH063_09429 [Colletotrichum higginsianum]|uniref:Uncharacterized protein n=1 Tax=Colletotrichum higginsianum (strain IMI 349063) TaxID=759273 RepID=H1VDK6_COLHI|nr:hypothetical protein CH063_09429 [Colletotrichum higginsianum]
MASGFASPRVDVTSVGTTQTASRPARRGTPSSSWRAPGRGRTRRARWCRWACGCSGCGSRTAPRR